MEHTALRAVVVGYRTVILRQRSMEPNHPLSHWSDVVHEGSRVDASTPASTATCASTIENASHLHVTLWAAVGCSHLKCSPYFSKSLHVFTHIESVTPSSAGRSLLSSSSSAACSRCASIVQPLPAPAKRSLCIERLGYATSAARSLFIE